MKKSKASAHKSTRNRPPRRTTGPKTVDAYLAATPQPARGTLEKIRAAIRSVVPADATEVISYGIPAVRYNGTLVWYAAFAKHCSFFPTASVIAAFEDELKGYKVSKGTLHFPVDNPLPATLVKKMVKMRLADVKERS